MNRLSNPHLKDTLKHLRNIRTSGSITSSSKALIGRILRPVDFSAARVIVELGSGDGCITRRMLAHMRPDALLLCVEVNAEFVTLLRQIDDPRLRVRQACASELPQVLAAEGMTQVDCVVSGLPLALLPPERVAKVLRCAGDCLGPQGSYMQFQYSLSHQAELKSVFETVKTDFVLRNFPPAFVYECRGVRDRSHRAD